MEIGQHTSRLGLATSNDGIHFTRLPEPVFYPAEDAQKSREWPGGVEDPRIVESEDGTYVLTYTQWNRVTYSIGIATSKDLQHWTKYGPAFLGAANGKYDHLKYKSGGIVTHLANDRLIAARDQRQILDVLGRRRHSSRHLHRSHPLDARRRRHRSAHRSPHKASGPLRQRLPRNRAAARAHRQPESSFSTTEKMIPSHGDPTLGPNAYAAGEALFDAHDPTHLIDRTEAPVLKPERPYEKTGQYVAGTTFAEGLVRFHNRWFLYYGCADSAVGVVATP